MKIKNCQLCHRKNISAIGKRCKTCDMLLKDSGQDFCGKSCRILFKKNKKEESINKKSADLKELNLKFQLIK